MADPKYITLKMWAERTLPKVPHRNTLHRWAADGSIVPRPFKVGREYMVVPHARYITEPAPAPRRLVDRLDGLTPA